MRSTSAMSFFTRLQSQPIKNLSSSMIVVTLGRIKQAHCLAPFILPAEKKIECQVRAFNASESASFQVVWRGLIQCRSHVSGSASAQLALKLVAKDQPDPQDQAQQQSSGSRTKRLKRGPFRIWSCPATSGTPCLGGHLGPEQKKKRAPPPQIPQFAADTLSAPQALPSWNPPPPPRFWDFQFKKKTPAPSRASDSHFPSPEQKNHEDVNGEKLTVKKWWIFWCRFLTVYAEFLTVYKGRKR